MGVDKLIRGKSKKARKQLSLKVREEVVEQVKQISQESGFTMGEVLEAVIDEGLEAYHRNQQRGKARRAGGRKKGEPGEGATDTAEEMADVTAADASAGHREGA